MGEFSKLIAVTSGATMLLLTGCQSIGNVNLDQYLLSSTEIKSVEGQHSISLDFTFDKNQVKDL